MAFISKLRYWFHYRRTYSALCELSPGQLRDIGLERGNIESISGKIAELTLNGRPVVRASLLWREENAQFHYLDGTGVKSQTDSCRGTRGG